ncbi:copper-translocating P-type ATPase, partial [mine drainage metagenome]
VLEKGYEMGDILEMAASLESSSNHPIAKAVVQYANDKNIHLKATSDVKEIPGVGITGVVNGRMVDISRGKINGGSTVSITIDNILVGYFSVTYKIRISAKPAIEALKRMGIKTSMITGDSNEEAKRIAIELGIDDIHAEILPADKSEIIKNYQKNRRFCSIYWRWYKRYRCPGNRRRWNSNGFRY